MHLIKWPVGADHGAVHPKFDMSHRLCISVQKSLGKDKKKKKMFTAEFTRAHVSRRVSVFFFLCTGIGPIHIHAYSQPPLLLFTTSSSSLSFAWCASDSGRSRSRRPCARIRKWSIFSVENTAE